MLPLNQVRTGAKIIFRAAPHEVVEANHHKMGRGGAKLVTKLRNLLTGAVYDYTFAGDEKLEQADLRYRQSQFLYSEGAKGFAMTSDSFETFELNLSDNARKFLREGEQVDLVIWQDQAIDLNLPKKVSLKVTYTEPGYKGNTTSAALKNATLETNATVNVPLFIKQSDVIVVNTESGEYVERA